MGDNNNNTAVVESQNLNAQISNLQASKLVASSQVTQSSSLKISSSSSTKITSSSSIKKSVSESVSTTSSITQVKEGSRAESVGIKLGDSIIRINGIPTEGMSLNEAQRALEYAGDDLRLTLSSFDDDDNESAPKETREVILAGKVKLPTPPPKEQVIEIEKPVFKRVDRPPEKLKQCWHPVMWHTPPLPNQVEDYGDDKPHGRIVRNVRRFLTNCKDPEERQRMIERMFLCLPTASKHKEDDPEEEEEERRKLAELRRLSLAMRGELVEE